MRPSFPPSLSLIHIYEYQLTLSQAEELCVEFENVNVLRAQVADLRGRIRALGNVNVSAICLLYTSSWA